MRDAIALEVRQQGFNPKINAYTRTYGSEELDAANLVLPVIGFERAASPRLLGTVDAIERQLSAGFPLVYRYLPGRDEKFGGPRGDVSPVLLLARPGGGRHTRSRSRVVEMEQLVNLASHLDCLPRSWIQQVTSILGTILRRSVRLSPL